jgi:uncharacterized protein with FMN-binding domain
VSDGGSHKKISNSLVALSSAAVLAVYTAGYVRTKSAADRFALQAIARRPVIPAPATSGQQNIQTLPTRAPLAVTSATAGTAHPESIEVSPVARPTENPPRVATGKRVKRLPPTVTLAPPVAAPISLAPAPVAGLPAAVLEQAPVVPPPLPPDPPKTQYKDGTYLGWGTSRHGDIQAQVIIQDGRILSATIAQCLTRYSCSVIAKLPPQVAERQSPETDYVSGATQSTNAFYYAVVEALSKAK